ncbi:hypothetical protein ABZP36_003789 [Zizania latifolia]
MVDHLKQGRGKEGQIVHIEERACREASFADLPNDLSEAMRGALKSIGISRLYSHQSQAIQSSISGKHVVVATSTSSGKSLCYNIPVLESLCQDLMACALYIFPTKALAQDQLRTLLMMKNALDTDIHVSIYDGDTPREDRMWIRNNAHLLITNPDMLHLSILPCHRQFQRILSNLRYIVIDEAHSYKGAFGCHTALILRRLKRICSNIYGSHPTFIFCTATSANPREHVKELAKLDDVELIQNDGSPCGFKYFLLWNPPLHMTKEGSPKDISVTRRSSPIVEVSYLFSEMVQHGLRCIPFCKTRKLCELVLSYTREILQENAKELVGSICVYRAGYIAEVSISSHLISSIVPINSAEDALKHLPQKNVVFSQRLTGLWIDVGHIDATLHLGFPGSIASLWQQAGRSGRRAKQPLAVYVAFEGPLDQYFMKFPRKLFGKPIEHCQVDSHNQTVLEQHLACAAYEHPLCLQYDEDYFSSSLKSGNGIVLMALKDKGYIINNPPGPFSSSMWSYIGPEKRPSQTVSIRAIEHSKYKVIDKLTNRLLEEIEENKAFFQVYEGAVYMHQGVNYLVEELDLSSRTAFCRKADLKYYTKTRDYTDVNVLGGDFAYLPLSTCKTNGVKTTAQANDCRVTTKWFGFYRVWKSSNKISDSMELNLPPYSFNSQAVWVRIPQSVKITVEERKLQFRGGSHAASHALLNIVPLYECANPHETRGIPDRILLYDKHPGGIGIVLQHPSRRADAWIVDMDDVLLLGAHDDGNLDVILPSAHDVIDGNLHCNQDGAHVGAVIAQQDGSLGSLLPGGNDDGLLCSQVDDSFDGNLHCNQDSAHVGVVVAQQDGSHDWLNELNDEDFSEWLSGMGAGCYRCSLEGPCTRCRRLTPCYHCKRIHSDYTVSAWMYGYDNFDCRVMLPEEGDLEAWRVPESL